MLTRIRSRDAYPIGRSWGVDPSHIAIGSGCRFAAVVSSTKNAYQIAPFWQSTGATALGSTLVGSIDATIGPALSASDASSSVEFINQNSVTDAQVTFGAIFSSSIVSPASRYATLIEVGGQFGLWVTAGQLNLYSNADHVSTNCPVSASVPYFAAATTANGSNIYFILKNLSNGKIVTDSVAGVVNLAPYATNVFLINDNPVSAADQIGAPGLAAVCANNSFIGPQGLLTWAEDPWGYWYRDDLIDYSFGGLPPPVTNIPFYASGGGIDLIFRQDIVGY